ncbi:MAG: hypothetical protein EPN91_06815 [Salinibacterium sp.]|nr:MAG: hypothetical protein EPN91_06815 [Salinibacterium sp.]
MTVAWTEEDLARVAKEMHLNAAHGSVNGTEASYHSLYFESCKRRRYGTNLIFSRDVGHHTSGWFKNPDYERCIHLSTSPVSSAIWTPDTPDLDKALERAWLKAFFGEFLRYVWSESPKTPRGKDLNVWHWRLFCNEHWEPILPRGEVYSRELTEAGWQSASELGIVIESPLVPG